MHKLIAGIQEFRRSVRPGYVERFAHLATGQSPDCLFIACSDSRVVPNLFASTDPGDLFVVRNVGNVVPPPGAPVGPGVGAAIEFAVDGLKVNDVVICGHSHCGAMKALRNGVGHEHPGLAEWLEHARPAQAKAFQHPHVGAGLPDEDRLSQLNVLAQIEHLRRHPSVRARLAAGSLRLHAWWFDLATAEVNAYDAATGRFTPVAPLDAEAP